MRGLFTRMAFLAAALSALPAHADSGDFALHKLGAPGEASDTDPSNRGFRIFANQLGCAMSSWNLSPPETLGHSGFNFAFEYAVVQVNSEPQNWPRFGRTTTGADSTTPPPSDMLLMPTAHVRKGLPFSFEMGAKISYLQFSRMTAATIEAKWALNEGFVYLPDLGVRGFGTRLIGARDFALTTAGFDIGLGKQIPVGGMLTLTPYAGWNIIYVNATSSVIDFAPDRSLENAQTKPTENTGVFKSVQMPQNHNNRFYFGLRFISYVFELGVEASITPMTAAAPINEDGSPSASKNLTTFAGKIGVDF